jgi:hypothetical protein
MKALILAACLCAFSNAGAQFIDLPIFHSTDPLAARDDLGLLHQSPHLVPPDTAPRHNWRPCYYFEAGRDLELQPAYVGALQDALHRRGYYCGPIDGIYSAEVSNAVAHMQKNYSQTVTGTITVAVRRALFLP